MKENDMGWVCGTYGEDKFLEGFGGKN